MPAGSPCAFAAAVTSRRYRIVDFKRRKFDVAGKVERLEYDPNRTSFIALIKYADGEQAYILAPQRLSLGRRSGRRRPGRREAWQRDAAREHSGGTIVHNVEMKIGKGGAIARSAGTYAQIVGRDQGYVSLRLNSGEQRLVHGQCFASVGAVSNPDHMNTSIGKAGRTCWLGTPAQSRRGDEPGRPSARRRRRQPQAAGIR